MATQEQVQDLKAEWRRDPCWDIEDTPGFEEHYEDLAAYHEEFRRQNRARRVAELGEKAERMGCPGNIALAAYVDGLEASIDALCRRLDALEGE